MIEEQSVPYLTYHGLAIKKKIELQVKVLTANTSQHRTGYSSFSEHYSAVWDNFIALQKLLDQSFIQLH